MDTNAKNFISLLTDSVRKTETDLQKPVDWSAVMSMASIHNVFPLVFERAGKYTDFVKEAEYMKYMTRAAAMVAAQTRRSQMFLKLYEAFSKEGIFPIVMKGIICRGMYGDLCDHRPSGDEDILIKKSEFDKAKSVLESAGYFMKHEEVTKLQIEDLQEVSFFEKNTGFHIELHLNPMGHENNLRTEMNKYFENVFGNYREVDIDGVVVRTMSHTDHFLFLVLHAFRNFTGGGFAVRLMLDILLYDEKYKDFIDWEYLKQVLRDLGAKEFLSDIVCIGNKYLGFSLPAFEKPNCPKELFEDMMSNGAFGTGTDAQRASNHMIGAAVETRGGRHKAHFAGTVLRTLFPTRQQMINKHPELKEKPWLLPVKWVWRWGVFLKLSKNNEGNLAAESVKISNRRIKLLKKYNII